MWSEIWGRQDRLGSDISSMSLSKPFSKTKYQGLFQYWDS